MKKYFGIVFLLVVVLGIYSCNNDDDNNPTIVQLTVEERLQRDQDSILAFFKNYYYQVDTTDFNGEKITSLSFKKITKEVTGPTLESELGEKLTKKVLEGSNPEVSYYVFEESKGGKDEVQATNLDSVVINYDGRYVFDNESFDSQPTLPVRFDQSENILGFALGIEGFSGPTGGLIEDDKGNQRPGPDVGLGAVFMPNILGYNLNNANRRLAEEPIYFTFRVLGVDVADHDRDGIPSKDEDANNNGNSRDDDTDGDRLPDFRDADDDNDGVLTRDEIEIDEKTGEVILTDTNGDGKPDYLDPNQR